MPFGVIAVRARHAGAPALAAKRLQGRFYFGGGEASDCNQSFN
jgi:hypothetical protein